MEKDEAIKTVLLADLADRFDKRYADHWPKCETQKVLEYREAQRVVRESADPVIREAVREMANLSLMLQRLNDEQLLLVAREPGALDKELALRELISRDVPLQEILEAGMRE